MDNKYLIIGGATKAGTTSLFNYLSDHPDICPAEFKETRYFLNSNYPLKRMGSADVYTLEEYERLFYCDKNQVRLEATPDYLFSENTAYLIKTTLTKCEIKFIFLLRNPVDRFISWYKFAKQDGRIGKNYDLKDFYKENNSVDNSHGHQHLNVLKQGVYSNYLRAFFNNFGNENVKIIYFDDFKNNTRLVLKDIAEFINADPLFYNDYEIKHYNKTVMYKYPRLHGRYKRIKRRLRELIRNRNIKYILKNTGQIIDNIYSIINKESSKYDKIRFDEDIRFILTNYYSEEIKLYNERAYSDKEKN